MRIGHQFERRGDGGGGTPLSTMRMIGQLVGEPALDLCTPRNAFVTQEPTAFE